MHHHSACGDPTQRHVCAACASVTYCCTRCADAHHGSAEGYVDCAHLAAARAHYRAAGVSDGDARVARHYAAAAAAGVAIRIRASGKRKRDGTEDFANDAGGEADAKRARAPEFQRDRDYKPSESKSAVAVILAAWEASAFRRDFFVDNVPPEDAGLTTMLLEELTWRLKTVWFPEAFAPWYWPEGKAPEEHVREAIAEAGLPELAAVYAAVARPGAAPSVLATMTAGDIIRLAGDVGKLHTKSGASLSHAITTRRDAELARELAPNFFRLRSAHGPDVVTPAAYRAWHDAAVGDQAYGELLSEDAMSNMEAMFAMADADAHKIPKYALYTRTDYPPALLRVSSMLVNEVLRTAEGFPSLFPSREAHEAHQIRHLAHATSRRLVAVDSYEFVKMLTRLHTQEKEMRTNLDPVMVRAISKLMRSVVGRYVDVYDPSANSSHAVQRAIDACNAYQDAMSVLGTRAHPRITNLMYELRDAVLVIDPDAGREFTDLWETVQHNPGPADLSSDYLPVTYVGDIMYVVDFTLDAFQHVLKNITTVAGDFVLGLVPNLKFDSLLRVHGNVLALDTHLAAHEDLRAVFPPKLAFIGGDLYITARRLTSLHGAQSIREVRGSITITNMTELGSLRGLGSLETCHSIFCTNSGLESLAGLTSLRKVTGVLNVTGNARMTTVRTSDMPALEALGQELVIKNNASVRTIDLTTLTEAPRAIVLEDCTLLETLDLPTRVPGGFGINVTDCARITHIVGANGPDSAAKIDVVAITQCARLTTLDAFAYTREVERGVLLDRCPVLADVHNPRRITRVGFVIVTACGGMRDLRWLSELRLFSTQALDTNSGVILRGPSRITTLAGLENVGRAPNSTAGIHLIDMDQLADVSALYRQPGTPDANVWIILKNTYPTRSQPKARTTMGELRALVHAA